MKQEDKELLLKDLCARLPYGVKLKGKYDITTLLQIRVLEGRIAILTTTWSGELNVFYKENLDECKPYLRPMSSMTEEEKELCKGSIICYNEFEGNSILFDVEGLVYLNKHMFDYCGLIEKGLAIEAPEGMYNLNNE